MSVLEYFLSENSFPDADNSVAYYIRHCIHFLSDFKSDSNIYFLSVFKTPLITGFIVVGVFFSCKKH